MSQATIDTSSAPAAATPPGLDGTGPGIVAARHCSPALVPLVSGLFFKTEQKGQGRCPVCGVPIRPDQATCSRRHADHFRAISVTPRGWYLEQFKQKFAELWLMGLSRREIANELGITMQSVIGLSHRMGLPRRERKPPDKPAKKAKRPKRPGLSVTEHRVRNAAVMSRAPIKVDRPPGAGCQFPTSDNPWRVCDDPREPGRPYCAHHCELAYQNWSKAA
jgi:hypothetical protein